MERDLSTLLAGTRGGPTLLQWVRAYQAQWLVPDLIAGATAAAVVIPKALGYATIASLPVQVGLYTCLVPMAVYALLGTSRVLSVSTTTTIAILTGAALSQVAPSLEPAGQVAALATLVLLPGAILFAAGLLRLGFVADFISEPVLVGFKAGVGIVIILDQLPKLLGLHFDKGSFLHNVLAIVQGLPGASVPTVALALAMVAILVGFERFVPRAPAPLVAVVIAILAMKYLELGRLGIEAVGTVPTGLPAPTVPDWHLVQALLPAAAGIALMSFTETIAAARAFAGSGEPTPDPDRELVATGVANAAGALLGAMPGGGGTSQTAVNRRAGARSQLAGLVTAVLALGAILLLAPFIAAMPQATLATVVIVYSVGLIRPSEFRAIRKVRRTEFAWALVALAGVVLLGTLQGIVVAIVVSLAAMAYQVSNPVVHLLGRKPGTNVFRPAAPGNPDDLRYPGLLLVRPEGRIFFANASRVGQQIVQLIAQEQPQVVALHLRGVFDLEYTALKMWTEAEQRLREAGVTVWLVGLNPGVLAMVRNSPLGEALGEHRMFHNLEQAVAHYQAHYLKAASATA
ncbi:SulP family inorganic anion transporter [Ramlibacter tataouinensis]|uniref:Sulfate transporter n=1 Tax=Ramlibacter tataouinensis TaxID=94132 RepID=A0A127JU11_9BURK|nr:SulP family inorganic anion transporter [Ramlibacter tataouinensis]AMO23457.1 sulfate transporter [Ramlibacter tataouinensis]